jgi:NADP-dependent 3-hydroxy acid dehydrogenase YdfG
VARNEVRPLHGKVVAITGGARGIGLATARACAGRGMKVAIGDLDLAEAKGAAESVPGAIALPLDVTDKASFERFLDDVDAQLGSVDVLVNNAGIMAIGSFLDEDDATATRMIDINVYGVLHGMKLVLPRFLARNTGHLVNIASSAGKGGFPGGATYCGTKHFVVGVSEAVRAEVRDTAIEVSCVMPGVVNTELATGLQESRGVKKVEPDDVAAEIVAALEKPRFDVFVPRSIGPISQVMNLMPRGGREAIGRALKVDKVLAGADQAARRGYELRAAHSDPGLEPGHEAKQLPGGDGDSQ